MHERGYRKFNGGRLMINVRMQTAEVKKLSPQITVIGVGGAGGNAVNNMISSGLEGVEFLVCNTDAQALENSYAENKIQLGAQVTGGLGAGSKPDVGRAAAEETLNEITDVLEGSNMVFITAGMGGGTGTGAAPVIARAAKDIGILTVAVVTKPFHFEGTHRMKMAEEGIRELQQYVDTQIVIPNQNLFRIANEKTTFAEAFKMADSVLQSGVRGVTDLMVMPGLINLDFADIRSAMQEMGKAMMGTGEATGERRAIEAAEAAISNPLLDDVSMKGARGVIINITGGYDMTLFEADEACNRIRDEVDPDANIIFGSTFDEKLENVMRVSVVATGIDTERQKRSRPEEASEFVSANSTGAFQTPNSASSQSFQNAPQQATARAGQPSPLFQKKPSRYAFEPAPASAQAQAQAHTAPVQQPAMAARPEVVPFAKAQTEMSPAEKQEAQYNPEIQKPAAVAQPYAPLRGQRQGDAFIPPRPAEVDKSEKDHVGNIWEAPMQYPAADRASRQMPGEGRQSSFHERQSQSSLSAAPADANPAPANPESKDQGGFRRKAFGFIEKITGHGGVQVEEDKTRSKEGFKTDDGFEIRHVNPAHQHPSGEVPGKPSQGHLNIETPSEKPQEEDKGIDIPAFLRRQAN